MLFTSAVRHKDPAQESARILMALDERNTKILEHLQHQEMLWSMQMREITEKQLRQQQRRRLDEEDE